MPTYIERVIREMERDEILLEEDAFHTDLDVVLEAESDSTYFVRDEIYPKVEAVLKTPEGQKKFSRTVGNFINKNTTKLTTIGPQYQITFGYDDKEEYYKLFNVTEAELSAVIKKIINSINAKANWLLMKQNPIFILFYCIIRYFTLSKDSKQLNNALAITALAFYPSAMSKYFEFEPNPGVMQYTIDNLSKRFIIKKSNHIFGTLTTSIQQSWKFHEPTFKDGSDKEVIRFVQRIRNDQNSLIKKIANNYYDNYKQGLTVVTSVDSFEDNAVVDNENDSNKVEAVVNKIVMKILVNGVNLKICDFAAQAAGISKIDLRNYLTKIIIEKNVNTMRSFIESILFIYLYDQKHTFEEINSKEFIGFALNLFKRTNSNDPNVSNIKNILEKWNNDTGITARFSRIPTRSNYSRGIFLYFVVCIQQHNQ